MGVSTETFWERKVIEKVKSKLSWDWNVSIEWVPREQNKAADFMAKQASREVSPRQLWRLPPMAIIEHFCSDIISS